MIFQKFHFLLKSKSLVISEPDKDLFIQIKWRNNACQLGYFGQPFIIFKALTKFGLIFPQMYYWNSSPSSNTLLRNLYNESRFLYVLNDLCALCWVLHVQGNWSSFNKVNHFIVSFRHFSFHLLSKFLSPAYICYKVRELEPSRFRKRMRPALYKNRSPLMRWEGAAFRLASCCSNLRNEKVYIGVYVESYCLKGACSSPRLFGVLIS